VPHAAAERARAVGRAQRLAVFPVRTDCRERGRGAWGRRR
jgi:hypothetical protein